MASRETVAAAVLGWGRCYALAVSTPDEKAKDSSLRVLRVISLYHLAVGGVLALLPGDLCSFLGLESPRYWLLYYVLASASLLAAAMLYLAPGHPRLRPGLVLAVVMGNLVCCGLFVFFVAWSQLPAVLFAPAVSSGLLAWLLWGLDDGEVAQ